VVLAIVVAAVLVMAKVIDSGGPGEEGTAPPTPVPSGPREALAHQLALIREGNVVALRATFTERLRDQITEASLEDAVRSLGSSAVEDLVGDEEEVGTDPRRVKLYMPGGRRSLTTFVQTDEGWLADTLWYR
jgi:hypothetical protein